MYVWALLFYLSKYMFILQPISQNHTEIQFTIALDLGMGYEMGDSRTKSVKVWSFRKARIYLPAKKVDLDVKWELNEKDFFFFFTDISISLKTVLSIIQEVRSKRYVKYVNM